MIIATHCVSSSPTHTYTRTHTHTLSLTILNSSTLFDDLILGQSLERDGKPDGEVVDDPHAALHHHERDGYRLHSRGRRALLRRGRRGGKGPRLSRLRTPFLRSLFLECICPTSLQQDEEYPGDFLLSTPSISLRQEGPNPDTSPGTPIAKVTTRNSTSNHIFTDLYHLVVNRYRFGALKILWTKYARNAVYTWMDRFHQWRISLQYRYRLFLFPSEFVLCTQQCSLTPRKLRDLLLAASAAAAPRNSPSLHPQRRFAPPQYDSRPPDAVITVITSPALLYVSFCRFFRNDFPSGYACAPANRVPS